MVETKKMLIQYATKVKFVEEVTGEALGKLHKKSVLLGFMDEKTREHTTQYHGVGTSDEEFYDEMLKFVNGAMAPATAVASNSVPMQIGAVQRRTETPCGPGGGEDGWSEEDWTEGQRWSDWDSWSEEEQHQEELHALHKGGKKGGGKRGVCYGCGSEAHFLANCPYAKGKGKGKTHFHAPTGSQWQQKGKGKGKDKGKGKGSKSRGKGPNEGCWGCGGPHYQSECPNSGGQIRVLASLTEVKNRYEALQVNEEEAEQ